MYRLQFINSRGGSPLIYSTGDITIIRTNGTSTGSQISVIEGKNKVTIKDNCNVKCNGYGGMNDNCGFLIYQSQPGDPSIDRSNFICENSNVEILSSSNVYSTAPFFYITNTLTQISLKNCTFTYGSRLFINASQNDHWGTRGENGADVILNLENQNIEGDLLVDELSELQINMKNSTIKGAINNAGNASVLKITLDSDSSIIFTSNSYYTSISNGDATGKNIINGSYNFSHYNSTINKLIDDSSRTSASYITFMLLIFIL